MKPERNSGGVDCVLYSASPFACITEKQQGRHILPKIGVVIRPSKNVLRKKPSSSYIILKVQKKYMYVSRARVL